MNMIEIDGAIAETVARQAELRAKAAAPFGGEGTVDEQVAQRLTVKNELAFVEERLEALRATKREAEIAAERERRTEKEAECRERVVELERANVAVLEKLPELIDLIEAADQSRSRWRRAASGLSNRAAPKLDRELLRSAAAALSRFAVR